MDPSTLLPYPVLAVGAMVLPLTFGSIFALTQAGMPSKFSYLAAIGIGALLGGLSGLAFFGPTQDAALSVLAGAIAGLPTQTASRRPADKIVTEGAAKLGEAQIPEVVITKPVVTVLPPASVPPGS